jgi:hypothetical protein
MMTGKKHSKETKKRMSLIRKGKVKSKEWKERIRQSLIGQKHTEERKRKNSLAHKGKHISPMTEFKKGHIMPLNIRQKIGQTLKGKYVGEKSPSWQGGKSFEPYTTDWTKTLKRAIRERDNYICQICSQYGDKVHHIDYNKANCNSENLITLCESCHSKTNFNRNYWINYFNYGI